MENENITIERNGESYTLLVNEPNENAVIDFIDSSGDKYGNAFWIYECSGLHTGKPMHLAIKNVHYDVDGDENGIYDYFTSDGLFWKDNLSESVCDAINDFYYELILENAKESYEED